MEGRRNFLAQRQVRSPIMRNHALATITRVTLLIAGLVAAPLPLSAFTGSADDASTYEIKLPVADSNLPKRSVGAQTASLPAAARPLAALPGLGVSVRPPNHMSATGRMPLVVTPSLFAGEFLASVRPEWAGPRGDFEVWDERDAGRLKHLLYRQTHAGIPVIGTRVQFTFGDAALLHVDVQTRPDLDLDSTHPTVSEPMAREASVADLPVTGDTRWTPGALLILPRAMSGLAEDHLVWKLQVTTTDPNSAWTMLVDAHSGELLERRSLILAADSEEVSGSVEADLVFPTPYGSPITVSMPNLTVAALDGTVPVASGLTNEQGEFDLGTIDAADLEVSFALAGSFVTIFDGRNSLSPPAVFVDDPVSPIALAWDESNSSAAARSAFYNVNLAHNRLLEIDPSFDWLNQSIPTVVNDSSASCNAYAQIVPTAPWLTFLRGNDTCTNSGEIADVVYHEYAHLITMYAYLPEEASDVYHEAFSDYFAATIMDTCLIGLDFRGEGTFLRSLENDLTWPIQDPYCAQDPHCVGLLLSGALWEIRKGLIEDLGDLETGRNEADRLYHFMRAGRPQDYQSCATQLLLQDDDDGDVTNGTPHLDLIVGAFESRNLGTMEVQFAHHPLPDTEEIDTPMTVDVNLSSLYPVVDGSVQIAYRTSPDGRYVVTPLEKISALHYQYEIPGQPEGTQIEYYLMASNEGEYESTYPAGAPEASFTLYVGVDEIPPVITHRDLETLTSDQQQVWLAAEVSDNTEHIRSVHAVVTLVTPEDTHTVERSLWPKEAQHVANLYEALVPFEGVTGITEVRYQLSALDASARENETTYPATGSVTTPVLNGRTWDIDVNSGGLLLDGDWQAGVPDLNTGAPVPTSGSELVATNLSGDHNIQLDSYLELPAFDFSSWTAGLMSFDSWYVIEDHWDGAWIEASINDGDEWLVLVPRGGYPSWRFDGHWTIPCFTGTGSSWEKVELPLDQFLGENHVRIRLVYHSDYSVTELGWYVDNISVQENQLLVSPAMLNASTGDNGQVMLGWSEPDGIDVQRPGFLGYNLYRSFSSDFTDSLRLTDSPRNQRFWIDTTVENGTRYYYAVTAVYSFGEGSFSPIATGYPYLAEMIAPSSVEVTLDGDLLGEETITVENSGTGDLNMSFYRSDVGATIQDVLPNLSLDSVDDEDWTLLSQDGAEGIAPDIASVSAREFNSLMQFRITLHDSLPNPEEDLQMVLFLDTDLDRSTGLPAYNTGADYLLALGAAVYAQTGLPAILVDSDYRIVEGGVAHLILQEGLDSLEVAISLPLIGSPSQVGFNLAVSTLQEIEALTSSPIKSNGAPADGKTTPRDWLSFVEEQWALSDQVPDQIRSDWLTIEPPHGRATPETPFSLGLSFNMSGLIEDQYEAQVLMRTNDPERPTTAILIQVDLVTAPYAELSYWNTTSASDGLLLEWAPHDPTAYDGFFLYRWSGELEDEDQAIQLGQGMLTASGDSTYSYLDRTAVSGNRFFYRLTGVTAGGEEVQIDPPAHRNYNPAPPTRLSLSAPWPNPFRNETLLRVNSPDANWDLMIVDVSGRMIRHLVNHGEGTAGVQIHAWNGRADSGSPAAMGVYYAVVRTGNRHTSRPVLLVR